MANAPFDRVGVRVRVRVNPKPLTRAYGVFSRVNLAKLAVKRGLEGGTLK